jgi:hypothetical protein
VQYITAPPVYVESAPAATYGAPQTLTYATAPAAEPVAQLAAPYAAAPQTFTYVTQAPVMPEGAGPVTYVTPEGASVMYEAPAGVTSGLTMAPQPVQYVMQQPVQSFQYTGLPQTMSYVLPAQAGMPGMPGTIMSVPEASAAPPATEAAKTTTSAKKSSKKDSKKAKVSKKKKAGCC